MTIDLENESVFNILISILVLSRTNLQKINVQLFITDLVSKHFYVNEDHILLFSFSKF